MVFARRTPDALYEPRALWEVRRLVTADLADEFGAAGPYTVELDEHRWYNGRRHTLVLTHLLLDAQGYLLRQNRNDVVTAKGTYRNAQSALNDIKLTVQAPFRTNFSRKNVQVCTFSPKAVADAPMDFTAAPHASSLHGISRWDFRQTCPAGPFWIPRSSALQFDMSGWASPVLDVGDDSPVRATMIWDEAPLEGYGLAQPGVSRLSDVRFQVQATSRADVFPAGPTPFPLDAFGPAVNPGAANSMWFHKVIKSQQWRGDETARGVTHKELQGFAMHIDQIAYDELLQTNFPASSQGAPISQLASSIGCRARLNSGGSGEWWWEPGAPISLVTPTQGSAHVFQFDEPIKLGKGESLGVTLECPGPFDQAGDIEQDYTIGVSMLGYAIVEG